MTPYEFGCMAGAPEKRAGGLGGFWAGMRKGTATAGKALSGVNDASRSIVRGSGGAVSSAGQLTDSIGQIVRGLGADAQRLGRRAIQPGPSGRVSMLGDLLGLLGHVGHAGGKATHLAGRGLSRLGKGIDELGQGIGGTGSSAGRGLADAPLGIPTLAAAGLLTAGANVAPKLPLPDINIQNPLDVNFGVKLRPPVDVKWPNTAASSSASSGSGPYGGGW